MRLLLIESDPMDSPARFVPEDVWEPTMPAGTFTDEISLPADTWETMGRPTAATVQFGTGPGDW